MAIEQVLRELGWVVTRRSLLTAGITRAQIEDALAAGTIGRLQPGVYGPPSGFGDVAAAVRYDGALSHGSAAQWLGLEMLAPPAQTHVTVPSALKKVAPPQISIHRADVPTLRVRQVWTTTPLRTVVDCLHTMPTPDAVVIADSAIRRGLVTVDEVQGSLASLRGRGAPRAKHGGAMIGRSESVLESACRVVLLEAGLPRPTEQLEIRTRSGVKRVDFAWPEQRVVLEAEGFATHGLRMGLVQDCVRTNGLQLVGWLVLRVAWEHVLGQPDYVAAIVAEALGSEPHRPRLRRIAA